MTYFNRGSNKQRRCYQWDDESLKCKGDHKNDNDGFWPLNPEKKTRQVVGQENTCTGTGKWPTECGLKVITSLQVTGKNPISRTNVKEMLEVEISLMQIFCNTFLNIESLSSWAKWLLHLEIPVYCIYYFSCPLSTLIGRFRVYNSILLYDVFYFGYIIIVHIKPHPRQMTN